MGVRRGNSKRSRKPTVFEEDLLGRGIELINSRPYHLQTNENLERLHRDIECRCEILPVYVECYVESRFLFSLDMANYETPPKAFSAKGIT